MAGAATMADIIDGIGNRGVRLDVVFTPITEGSSFENAEEQPLGDDLDKKARVWWDDDNLLSDGIAEHMPTVDIAWDIYMFWEAGRTWGDMGDDTPGAPDFWMHKLGGMPQDSYLDPDVFADEIKARVPTCEVFDFEE